MNVRVYIQRFKEKKKMHNPQEFSSPLTRTLGSIPGRAAIKLPKSTQPSILWGR